MKHPVPQEGTPEHETVQRRSGEREREMADLRKRQRYAERMRAGEAEGAACHRPDPACEACNGAGQVAVRPTSCRHMSGCCPCGHVMLDCDECGGSGRPKCDDCREHDATERVDGLVLCAACAAAEWEKMEGAA